MFFINFRKNRISKPSQGFTLVEIMVAVTIFSLVMMVAIGAVLSIVNANKKGQALSSVINNLNFALESMNRDLRTGTEYNDGVDCPGGCSSVEFISSLNDGEEVTYSFSGHTINKRVGSGGDFVPLISSEVFIESLNFYIVDTDRANEGDYNQARIFVTIKGCAAASRQPDGCDTTNKNISNFNLQTLLTQRRLDS